MNMFRIRGSFAFSVVLVVSLRVVAQQQALPYMDPAIPVDRRVDDLIG
jgi:hypothetical protein